jgi:thymidylate synthase
MIIIPQATTSTVRRALLDELTAGNFVIDKTGVKTIELINASFIADEPAIFGEPNHEWNARELEWYESMSLNVNDIPSPIPAIWKQVADKDGFINSNYGWCIWSKENNKQYQHCFDTLMRDPNSRRACMIYTRPNMQVEYNLGGRSDFMCTYATQHFIREGELISCVLMRSNDSIFGYRGDYAWQKHVHDTLAEDLNVKSGKLIWNAMSLHVYERHFHLVK